jgi:hypothetical protein
MLGSIRTRVVAVASAAALSVALAAPASAQQAGLVNVEISDVLDVTGNAIVVQVPIGVAANVCGVNVAVLAQGEQETDPVCDAESTQFTEGQARAFGISD